MKKKYETCKIEIIYFKNDVLTGSDANSKSFIYFGEFDELS